MATDAADGASALRPSPPFSRPPPRAPRSRRHRAAHVLGVTPRNSLEKENEVRNDGISYIRCVMMTCRRSGSNRRTVAMVDERLAKDAEDEAINEYRRETEGWQRWQQQQQQQRQRQQIIQQHQ